MQVADNPFLGALATGDSASQKDKSKMEEFREKLERMKSGLEAFTIVLDDPAGNSYMQDLYLPGTSLCLICNRVITLFTKICLDLHSRT